MEQKLKDEIYDFIANLDLNDEELEHIDTYVNELLSYLMPILSVQDKVLSDNKEFEIFRKMIIEKIGG